MRRRRGFILVCASFNPPSCNSRRYGNKLAAVKAGVFAMLRQVAACTADFLLIVFRSRAFRGPAPGLAL